MLSRLDVHVLMDWLQPHFAQLPPRVWRMLLSGPSCLRDASQVQDRYPFLQVILAQHWCAVANRHPLAMKMRLPCSSFLVLFKCRCSHNFGVHHRNVSVWCSKIVINFHTSVTQQQISVPAFFFVSSPNTSTHHYCCTVAHDVLSRSRVETEANNRPTTSQQVSATVLLSCSRRHCRHGTSSMSMLHVPQAMSKTCPELSLNVLNFSLNAAVVVAFSVWTLFVHDFGWDVCARFVFNVNDARLLVAL